MSSNLGKYICFDCGPKYLTKKQREESGHAVTAHKGECCECKEIKLITSVRHYNYLIKVKKE